MKAPESTSNTLLFPRIILTVSIIAISIVSYYFITRTSNVLSVGREINKIASRQRTLCSQVVNSIAADNIGGKLEGPPLEETLTKFTKGSASFFKTDSILNLHLGSHNLNNEYAGLNEAYDALLSSISINLAGNSTNYFVELLTAEDNYLQALDKYASALNIRSTEEARTFKMRETTVLVVSLVFVFLEIIFLFLPAVRKINKQNKELSVVNHELKESHKLLQSHLTEIEEKNKVLKKIAHIQSHEIRHPLTSVMALVSLAEHGHPINEKWLQMMHDASQSLDTRIKSIIKESGTDKELKVVRYDKMVEEIEEFAMVLLDEEGKIESWNKGAEKVLGYKDYEVIGKNFSIFFTEANKKATHIYYLLEQATDKGFIRDEGSHVKKDGSEFYASTLITAIHDNADEIIGFTGIIRPFSDADKSMRAQKSSA
jgi:PAS domain S-box-containing protein